MTVPRDVLMAKVREWAMLAEEDLRAAEHLLTLADRCPFRLVAYHSQQCAEKYLKAFLVLHGVDFPYTHNIARLLELCADRAAWTDDLKDAEELTPFAIAARYPGEDDPVTESEARRAVEIARRVRELLRKVLAADGAAPEPLE